MVAAIKVIAQHLAGEIGKTTLDDRVLRALAKVPRHEFVPIPLSIEVVDSFYDAAVSGADPVGERPGFKAMMDRIAGNGVRVIIVESPDRFARDLAVQIAGHDYLKGLGVVLVPTSAPDFFTEDTPTAVLVRQVLGAIAQFEKASLVAKMKAARDRNRAATGYKVGGRKRYDEDRPEVVALAHKLARRRRKGWPLSLRQISAALADAGQVNSNGAPYAAASVQRMLQQRPGRAAEKARSLTQGGSDF
jgi:DNA invertase Pin-like site-specific DNA recombinase